MVKRGSITYFKSRLKRCTIFFIWIAFSAFLYIYASNIKQVYQNIHVRFNEPISSEQAFALRKLSTKKPDLYNFWPTYWSEITTSVSTELSTVENRVILFSGDANIVWPTKFIAGGHPSEISTGQASISNQLAYKLWGDYDVIGFNLEINKTKYSVCGVFESNEQLALISLGNQTPAIGWQSIVLQEEQTGEPLKLTEDYLFTAGINNKASIFEAYLISEVSIFLSFIPYVSLIIFTFINCIRWLCKSLGTKKTIAIFILALITALILPYIFDLIPIKLIPSKWSDYSFWQRLVNDEYKRLITWISISPYTIDINVKIHFYLIIILLIPSTLFTYILFKELIENSNENDNINECLI